MRAGRPLVRTTISIDGLARTYRAAVHQSSAIQVKRNILTSTFIPHRWLSKQAFSRFAHDFLVFGNAYLEKHLKRLGQIMERRASLAKYTHRDIDPDTYWFAHYGYNAQPYQFQFDEGSVFHPKLTRSFMGCRNTSLPFRPPC